MTSNPTDPNDHAEFVGGKTHVINRHSLFHFITLEQSQTDVWSSINVAASHIQHIFNPTIHIVRTTSYMAPENAGALTPGPGGVYPSKKRSTRQNANR